MSINIFNQLTDIIRNISNSTNCISKSLIRLVHLSIESEKLNLTKRSISPNLFYIYIGSDEFNKYSSYISILKSELKSEINNYIKSKGYICSNNGIQLNIEPHPDFEFGEYNVEAMFLEIDSNNNSKTSSDTEYNNICQHGNPSYLDYNTTVIDDQTRLITRNNIMSLNVIEGDCKDQRFVLSEGIHTFGRGINVDFRLPDSDLIISREHFNISIADDISILDTSANGTYINDRKIDKCSLTSGDIIKVGSTSLQVIINKI